MYKVGERIVMPHADDFEALGDRDVWLDMGNSILTLAVLSILITAPIGAVSILALGPKLLTRDATEEEGEQQEEFTKDGETSISCV